MNNLLTWCEGSGPLAPYLVDKLVTLKSELQKGVTGQLSPDCVSEINHLPRDQGQKVLKAITRGFKDAIAHFDKHITPHAAWARWLESKKWDPVWQSHQQSSIGPTIEPEKTHFQEYAF